MQVRLIERSGAAAATAAAPATPAAPTLGGTLGVAAFEAAKMEGHDRALGRGEEESSLCGVDKWYDNHWGLDQSVVTIGDYVTAMRARNWTYYHLWSWNMQVDHF